MTNLSVNINKIATIRNARGGDNPNVVSAALFIEKCGAQGITVHPRPDGRHIRHADVFELKQVLTTEFNIEGNPTPEFIDLVMKARPAQVTMVPDAPDALTSNAGWNTVAHKGFLRAVCEQFHSEGIRCSIFVDPDPEMVKHAADCGCDRVELYTFGYAEDYPADPHKAVEPYVAAAEAARDCGLGLNAGHDLSLVNLKFFRECIPWLDEVSIGHALICDALYMGLEASVKAYLKQLE
ncbi:MAG: pyridoxine 5'-phosphate synthase [Bacteroidales bacterium]|nr:pyridoxine 5'-phosphate synthase [Bacteroidales bacterium]